MSMNGPLTHEDVPKGTVFNDKSLTVQSPKDEVDINKIVARVQKGALLPELAGQPFYGDVSQISDLQDAIIKVQEANALFMQYPAELRERFQNDPVKLVDFFADDANIEEAVELGLAQKRPVEVAPAAPAPAQ